MGADGQPLADVPLESVGDVVKALAGTFNQVRKGEVDPKTGNCLGLLAGQLLRALQEGELADEIEALRRDPSGVRGDCETDRPAAAGVCLGVRRSVMDNTVCVSSPCVYGALCGSVSGDEEGRSVLCGGSRQRRKGWRH
jgi:hypothetical protein